MSQPIRKTRKAWNIPGHAHFLTYSCYRRLPLLSRDRTRRWVIDAMQRVRADQQVELWVYVVMPEHVHLLIFPRERTYERQGILAGLKRPVAAAARKHLESTRNICWLDRLTVRYPARRVFRFWQPWGGFDHNTFRERTVPAVIDYIHANPVRRGLVDRATNSEWSSARFWNGDRAVPVQMDSPRG